MDSQSPSMGPGHLGPSAWIIITVVHYTLNFLDIPYSYTMSISCTAFQSRAWTLGKSLKRPSCFLYFREIRNKQRHWPGGQSALRLYNSYDLCPSARPAHVGECGPGPAFKISKTVEVAFKSDLQSVRDRHWRNSRRQKV